MHATGNPTVRQRKPSKPDGEAEKTGEKILWLRDQKTDHAVGEHAQGQYHQR